MPSAPQGAGQHERRFDAAAVGHAGRFEDQPERLGLQRVAREDGERLAEGLVVRGLAAAQVVVVHARQVVVDERIVVHQLQRAGIRQRQMPVDPAQPRKLERQHRADAFAAGEDAVAHGFIQPRIGLVRGEQAA